MPTTKTLNIDTLTAELSTLFYDLKNKRVDPTLAHELNNTAANIQGSIRLALLNSQLQGKTPDLAFFRTGRAKHATVRGKQ